MNFPHRDRDGHLLAVGDAIEVVGNSTAHAVPLGAKGVIAPGDESQFLLGTFPEGTWPKGRTWSETQQWFRGSDVRKVDALSDVARILLGGASA